MSDQAGRQRDPDEPWIPEELSHLAYLSFPPDTQGKSEVETAALLRKRLEDFHAHREELERHGCYPEQVVRFLEALVPALEHRLQPADDPEQHRLHDIANGADATRLALFMGGDIIERAYEKDPWDPVNQARKETWDEIKKHLPKEP